MPIAMEPAKGVQVDAVVVSPHKFIRDPAASGIQAVGASLLYLPPYSPDFNPIEMAFPNSRRCCALPRRARCTIFGKQSPTLSTDSRQTNAETISSPQDTMQRDWKML